MARDVVRGVVRGVPAPVALRLAGPGVHVEGAGLAGQLWGAVLGKVQNQPRPVRARNTPGLRRIGLISGWACFATNVVVN
eukprot:16344-Hanusia_phi.AAC.12